MSTLSEDLRRLEALAQTHVLAVDYLTQHPSPRSETLAATAGAALRAHREAILERWGDAPAVDGLRLPVAHPCPHSTPGCIGDHQPLTERCHVPMPVTP